MKITKKFFSIFMVIAMIFATSSLFSSCGGDDFEDDANNGNIDNGNVEVSVVGVWECTDVDYETNNPEMIDSDLRVGEKVSIKTDGTYSTTYNMTGKWKKNGNYLNIIQNAAYAIAVDYTIEKLTSTEMVLYGDMQLAKVKYKFKRVNNNGNNNTTTSGLVGKWVVVSDYSITDFGKRLEHEPGAIWMFTDKTLTIYNEKDLYNGKSVEYTYSDGRIYTSGFPVRNVVELTDTKLVLTCITFAGYDQTVTLEREE